jgi:hypothetical protein
MGFSGAPSGSFPTPAIYSNSQYTITCTN